MQWRPIGRQIEPLAIAMWDLSWLLRHQKGGAFEDWDRALQELVARGYNAVRIDAFPHLVAGDADGQIQDRYYFPKKNWTPNLWDGRFSVYARPREGLIEFMRRCRHWGVHVGLATWFGSEPSGRHARVRGSAEFVRVWAETLALIEQHDLMDVVLYVDLLNEFPFVHEFDWLKQAFASISKRSATPARPADGADAATTAVGAPESMSHDSIWEFYAAFSGFVIGQLKPKWPQLDYMTSLLSHHAQWRQMGLSHFDALDVHCWFVFEPEFHRRVREWDIGYWDSFDEIKNDQHFERGYAKLREYWSEHSPELLGWLETRVRAIAEEGNRLGVPYGNTEGWGPVHWMDHPLTDWNWVRETAEIGVKLGAKHGYAFNCTSNFTHPQFREYWQDVQWHREMTRLIRRS